MKMKVDLSKFKLKHRDDQTATLIHPDGHEVRIAISALHPNNRPNLDKLELHESEDTMSDDTASKEVTKMPYMSSKKMADGGELAQSNPKLEESKKSPRRMAEGGEAIPYEQLIPQEEQASQPYTMDAAPQMPQQPAQPMAQPQAGAMQQAQMASPMASGQAPSPQAPTTPTMAGQEAPTSQPNALQTLSHAPDQSALSQVPGYNTTAKGIEQQAHAEQQAAADTTAIYKGQAEAQQKLSDEFTATHQQILDHVSDLQQDIKDGHIDPNRYLGSMNTGQKIGTAISLALGGLGSANGASNAGMDFLNKQIDRDIKAQESDLGNKHTLLSANLQLLGDQRAATDMTRLMMNGMAQTQVQAAMAKSGSGLAAARGQILLGELQKQAGPMAMQLSIRQMLANGGSNRAPGSAQGQPGELSKTSPAQAAGLMLKANMINDHQYDEISKEIERNENTRNVRTDIDKLFKQASDDTKGLGRIGSFVKEPRSVQGLKALLGTTVTDITGTARQAEFDNMERFIPNHYDTEADTKLKQQELNKYMEAKASAPIAKGLGLDLEKFQSTALKHESGFTPQQQSFLKWARENPNDPKAVAVFKKLGIN